MKSRNFKVYIADYEWNFSGLSSLKDTYIKTIRDFVPSVSNVRSFVRSLCPNDKIDETYMKLFEQIHSNLDIGMITIRLKGNDMFRSRSVYLQEIF